MTARRDNGPPIDVELVEYLVVAVPHSAAAEVVLAAAAELDARGLLRIYDSAIVAPRRSGVEPDEPPAPPSGVRESGVPYHAGLLTAGDRGLIAESVPPDHLGVVIVAEDSWASSLASAARSVGGYIAGGERIAPSRLRQVVAIP